MHLSNNSVIRLPRGMLAPLNFPTFREHLWGFNRAGLFHCGVLCESEPVSNNFWLNKLIWLIELT